MGWRFHRVLDCEIMEIQKSLGEFEGGLQMARGLGIPRHVDQHSEVMSITIPR